MLLRLFADRLVANQHNVIPGAIPSLLFFVKQHWLAAFFTFGNLQIERSPSIPIGIEVWWLLGVITLN
jgi:hypothetical protein